MKVVEACHFIGKGDETVSDEKYIGLTARQIEDILSEGIAMGKITSATNTRTVIAQAIEENNKKLLKDIEQLFGKNPAKFG
jgi:radical SAM superfamily enzyme